jgi:mono/diheme cytochrome c family protein
LVRDYKCFACHDEPGQYSTFTPVLDGVGEKVVARGWIATWLKNPKAFRPETKMPNFFLSDDERGALTDFLMDHKTFAGDFSLEPLPRIYDQRKETADFIDSGRTLFRESPCSSCHLLNGEGGRVSSDLAKIGSKAMPVWIYNFIRNPQGLQPGVEMPRFGFPADEVAAITAYFESELLDWDAYEEDTDLEIIPDLDERGRSFLYQYNCLGCHSLSGVEVAQNGGPEHLGIGSKCLYEIWFGETFVPHTLHDYIDFKLKTPRIFGESMRMPQFNFSDEDRHAVTTYLLSLRDEELPHAWMRRKPAYPEFIPRGKFGEILQKYSCLKCHSVQGRGESVAPDLTLVGSRLQRDWIKRFLNVPISRRPLVEERMLKLFMAEDEINTVIDYFVKILVDDSLNVPGGWRPTREAEERGGRLFWETYGCQSCHTVDNLGGYIGPPLDGAGDRLQPGWILHWLLDPQKYIPDTIEPRSGMSMEEAMDVVAYLMRM